MEFSLRVAVPESLRFIPAGKWLVVGARDESGYLVRRVMLATGFADRNSAGGRVWLAELLLG